MTKDQSFGSKPLIGRGGGGGSSTVPHRHPSGSIAIKLTADFSEAVSQISWILDRLTPELAELLPDHIRDFALRLISGGLPDEIAGACGSATVAGEHVIRFRIVGDMERLRAAILAREVSANSLGHR